MKAETKQFFKKVFIAGLIFGLIVFLMVFFVKGVRAEDNKTIVDQSRTAGGYTKILDSDKWSTQLLWDTTNACYQGTIRWIVMTNPSLLGQAPNIMAQRQMVVHCFCVVDKIRNEHTLEEYFKKVLDPQWTGNLFMLKAMECVREWQTLPLFFTQIYQQIIKQQHRRNQFLTIHHLQKMASHYQTNNKKNSRKSLYLIFKDNKWKSSNECFCYAFLYSSFLEFCIQKLFLQK